MLVSGSELSGQRRRQGAKMMARALGDMRFTSSSRATLRGERQLGVAREAPRPEAGALGLPRERGRRGNGAAAPWRWAGVERHHHRRASQTPEHRPRSWGRTTRERRPQAHRGGAPDGDPHPADSRRQALA